MKNRKKILVSFGIIVAIIIVVISTMIVLNDEERLTLTEKEWINNNSNKKGLPEIKVINDTDIFGNSGSGVFYDFISDFEENYNVAINEVTYISESSPDGLALKMSTEYNSGDVLFFTDHYVLIGKDNSFVSSLSEMPRNIGILSKDKDLINRYVNTGNNNIVEYNTAEDLFSKLDEGKDIQYVLVPRMQYISKILASNYHIVYHLADISIYYYLQLDDSVFASILEKYSKNWINKSLNKAINQAELDLFTESLNIQIKDMDKILATTYNYGFINNSPYELYSSGTSGGIASSYIHNFSNFSGIDIKLTKYKSQNALNKALGNESVDILFGFNNTALSGIDSGFPINYAVVAKKGDLLSLDSIKGLVNTKVYVLANSPIESYLKNISGISVSTYESKKELEKLADDGEIIVLDATSFNYYSNDLLDKYTVRYKSTIGSNYTFRVTENKTLTKLMESYFKYLNPNEIASIGLYEHEQVLKSGTIAGTIAKYSLYLLGILFIAIYITYRSTRRVKIVKRIKKEDKMRFIDQMTSLKNRNYLNENIDNWNKNNIYPQATIVIDLNQVQEINDSLGYEEGDKQIKFAANVLIKTQLDNSDIIRTDGNEFLIYLIGYQEKQIASYMRKLSKEFKNLPYEYGAAIGYSMITDDLKTVEDAINEAVDQVKTLKNKEE